MINRIEPNRIGAAVALAAVLLGGWAESAKQESTGEYFDDTALTAKAKTALLQDPQASGPAIAVETFKGTIQLSGCANSAAETKRRLAPGKERSRYGYVCV